MKNVPKKNVQDAMASLVNSMEHLYKEELTLIFYKIFQISSGDQSQSHLQEPLCCGIVLKNSKDEMREKIIGQYPK